MLDTNILLEYKDFRGRVRYNRTEKMYWGKIIGIKDTVLFDGATPKELIETFHYMIDDYIQWEYEQAMGEILLGAKKTKDLEDFEPDIYPLLN